MRLSSALSKEDDQGFKVAVKLFGSTRKIMKIETLKLIGLA